MRFGSQGFARSLRARVHVAARRRKATVPSAWRNSVTQRRVFSPLVFRIGLPAFGIFMAGAFRDAPAFLAGVAGWWWLVCVLTKAGELLSAKQMHPWIGYAAHYPMEPVLLWGDVRRRLAWAWVCVMLEYSAGLALLGGIEAWEGALPIALVAGMALASLSLAAVLAAQRYLPGAWCGRIGLAGFGLGAAGVAGGWIASKFPGAFDRYFLPAIETGATVSPGGWLTLRFLRDGAGLGDRWLWWCGVLVAAIAILYALGHGVAGRMVAAFRRQDEQLYRASESDPHGDAGDGSSARCTREEVLTAWRSATSTEPWRNRWLFGGLDACGLSGLRAIWPAPPRVVVQVPWRVALIIAPVVLRPALAGVAPQFSAMMNVIAGALLWFSVVPLALSPWKAFAPVAVGLRVAGWHAFYPVGYWGLSRALLRVEVARAVGAWPWLTAFVLLNLQWTGLSLDDHVAVLVASAGLAVAVQPLRIVAAYSRNSRDSSRVGVVVAGLVALALMILALFATAALTGAWGAAGTSLGLMGVVAVPVLIWAVYGWLYVRLAWDLLRTPPR